MAASVGITGKAFWFSTPRYIFPVIRAIKKAERLAAVNSAICHAHIVARQGDPKDLLPDEREVYDPDAPDDEGAAALAGIL